MAKTKETGKPGQPQMGGNGQAPRPEQASEKPVQQGSGNPPTRYTDWASI